MNSTGFTVLLNNSPMLFYSIKRFSIHVLYFFSVLQICSKRECVWLCWHTRRERYLMFLGSKWHGSLCPHFLKDLTWKFCLMFSIIQISSCTLGVKKTWIQTLANYEGRFGFMLREWLKYYNPIAAFRF